MFLARKFLSPNSTRVPNLSRSFSTSALRKKFEYSYAYNQFSPTMEMVGRTIGEQVSLMANERPTDIAMKFCLTQQTFSFLELKQRVDELAQNLLNMGFIKGDKIAVMLPNIPETALITLAAASIGVVTVLMNPAYQLVEVEYMVKKSKCKGIFILDNLPVLKHYELLKKICPELEESTKGELNASKLPDLKHVFVCSVMPTKELESKHKGTWSFNEVKKHKGSNKEMPYVDYDDDFVMMFTSGSTGFPKAAPIRHSAIINTARSIHFYSGCSVNTSFKNICIPIPVFHIFGLTCGLVSSITNGNTTTFPHMIPDTLASIKALSAEKCTAIKAAPTIFMDIINHSELKKYPMPDLQTMLIGASTVPKDLLFQVKERLGVANVLIGYAQTESGCAGAFTCVTDVNRSEKAAYESIGRNFIELKIVDQETRQLVPVGVDGEICLRGYSIMKGYHEDPERTKSTIDENGWLKTGDVGYMDENGYIYFKARGKEIVIRGGINIYPPEVEKFLRTHPSIQDCYVFGVPDERFGEELCVWIKLNPNAPPVTPQDVKDFCKGNIAHFKVPKYYKFVEAFPVSATAKVQKFKMIEQMKQELKL